MGDRTGIQVRSAIFVLLLLIGAFFVVPADTVAAAEEDGYVYSVSGGGEATITDYIGPGGSLVIPSTLGGFPVVAIGEAAFAENAYITSVTIPNGVTSIGISAFMGCYALISVTIPNSVTSLGEGSFSWCPALISANIPSNVVTIGNHSFSNCYALASAIMPDSVTSLGHSAFYGCSALTSVTIPNNLAVIKDYTFGQCTALTSVYISSSVTSIADWAFFGCSALTVIDVNASNSIYASLDGILYNKTLTILFKCPATKPGAISIPSSVTSIKTHAFYGCTALTSVTMGSNVTSIEINAFFNCVSLASVTIGSGLTYIGNGAFYFCSSLTSITFLGLVAPTVDSDWISYTHPEIRGHAYTASDFPPPGGSFNGLIMGDEITIAGSPSQPENFTATGGNSQVTLSWTAPADQGSSAITNYNVYRSGAEFGTYPLLSSPVSPAFLDTTVTNGQTYWYEIGAVNIVGEGVRTASISSTPFTVPDAPMGLTAIAGNANVSLSWTTPAFDGGRPIDYYVIYQNGVALPDNPTGVTMVIAGLNNGQGYSFKVAAHNSAGNSIQSSFANATPYVSVPSTPTLNLSFTGSSIIGLVWSLSDDGNSPINGYRVYRSTASDGVYALIASPLLSAYNDTDLVNGQTYWYKVSAINAIGASANSSAISATPLAVPDAPTGVTAIPGDAQVSLSWSAPALDGGLPIDYYVVYQVGIELPDHPTGVSIVITGLINGRYYNFTVAAHNAVGIGAQSITAYSTPIGAPEAPIIVAATPGSSFVILSWTAPLNDGGSPLTGYKLYRSTTSDGTFSLIASPTSLTYTDTGLTNGQDYWYKVSAFNAIGEGAKCSSYLVTVGIQGLTSHDSGKGYSILVPSGWTVEEDVTLGGYHADTYIMGPISHGVQTNVVVVTGTDPSIRDTQAYLAEQVQATLSALETALGMDVVITDAPQYVEISNRSAVIFGLDIIGSGMHQQGVIIIDAEHTRYWTISCTESVDARSEFDQTFDIIVNGFVITSVPGLTSTDVLIIVVIAGIVGVVLIGVLAYLLTRKKCPKCGKRIKKDWAACIYCGNPLGIGAPSSCKNCGAKLEPGWNICPKCGKGV